MSAADEAKAEVDAGKPRHHVTIRNKLTGGERQVSGLPSFVSLEPGEEIIHGQVFRPEGFDVDPPTLGKSNAADPARS